MKKIKLIIMAICLNSCIGGIPNAKFSINVIDQSGKVIEDATVRAEPRKVISRVTETEKKTNHEGSTTFRVATVLAWVNCYINKEHYYKSG